MEFFDIVAFLWQNENSWMERKSIKSASKQSTENLNQLANVVRWNSNLQNKRFQSKYFQ